MSKPKQYIETLTLTKEGSESFFYNALCNGLSEISHYGLQLKYKEADYQKAKKSLQAKIKTGKHVNFDGEVCPKDETISYEDVFMEILKLGGKLSLKDNENGMGTKTIGLKQIHERVAKTPLRHLMEYINDTGGDAITADVVLQTVFYKDIIFS